MSRQCEICGKKPLVGNLISHSHRKTRTRWLPNLQTVRVTTNGTKKKMKVCTRCLKKGDLSKKA